MQNGINIDRLMEALSSILSDKHGYKITLRAIPKESAHQNKQKVNK